MVAKMLNLLNLVYNSFQIQNPNVLFYADNEYEICFYFYAFRL